MDEKWVAPFDRPMTLRRVARYLVRALFCTGVYFGVIAVWSLIADDDFGPRLRDSVGVGILWGVIFALFMPGIGRRAKR